MGIEKTTRTTNGSWLTMSWSACLAVAGTSVSASPDSVGALSVTGASVGKSCHSSLFTIYLASFHQLLFCGYIVYQQYLFHQPIVCGIMWVGFLHSVWHWPIICGIMWIGIPYSVLYWSIIWVWLKLIIEFGWGFFLIQVLPPIIK